MSDEYLTLNERFEKEIETLRYEKRILIDAMLTAWPGETGMLVRMYHDAILDSLNIRKSSGDE